MLKKARVPQIFKGRTETAQFALEESEKFKGLLQKAGMAK
jgi:hypothetical protein